MLEYPPLVRNNAVSWHTMVTTDLLPTIMDLLNVTRPIGQASWASFNDRTPSPLRRKNMA